MPLLFRNLLLYGLLYFTGQARAADTLRLYFPTNGSQINGAIRKTLDSALYFNFLRPDAALAIVGYADFRGSTPFNQQLSQSRADAVRAYLLQNAFSTRRMIGVTAKGELPVVGQPLKDGIASHRRVDVIVGSPIGLETDSLKTPPVLELSGTSESSVIPEQLSTTVIGQTFRLSNLYFPPGKHVFYEDSKTEIEALATALKERPTLRIRIEGHVCCIDTNKVKDALDEQTNEYRLSENRAQFVVNFLIKLGIAGSRLESVGFGKQRPIVVLDTRDDSAAAVNRRVEIRILEK